MGNILTCTYMDKSAGNSIDLRAFYFSLVYVYKKNIPPGHDFGVIRKVNG